VSPVDEQQIMNRARGVAVTNNPSAATSRGRLMSYLSPVEKTVNSCLSTAWDLNIGVGEWSS